MRLALMAALGIAALTPARAAQEPLASLAAQVERNAAVLASRGEDTGPEAIVANGTWPLFEQAMQWDAAHPTTLAAAWCAFDPRLTKAQCAARAQSQASNQTAQLRTVLTDAVAQSSWAAAHPGARASAPRPAPGPGTAAISRRGGGFLVANATGRAFVTGGYNFAPGSTPVTRALGMALGGAFLSPPSFSPSGPTPSPQKEAELADQLVASARESSTTVAFVSQTRPLPPWAAARYPGINDCVPPLCRAHFMGYDMFNAGAEAVIGGVLRAAVSGPVANATARLGAAPVGSWLLANEPCVHAVNSSAAQAAYRAYLRRLYSGSVAALNAAYGTDYASFGDASVTPTPPVPLPLLVAGPGNASNMRAARRFREWQVLTSSTFRGLFAALARAVGGGPGGAGAPTHLKVAANHIALGPHACSLDLVGLLDDHAVAGTDSRATPPSGPDVFPPPLPRPAVRYSGFYLSQMAYFPFARSLAPRSALFDSETHEVSTERWRGALPRGFDRFFHWLSTLLGRSMLQSWYWGRGADGALNTEGDDAPWAADSALTQPFAVQEMAQATWETTALAPSVAALVSSGPRPVAVWYSGLSMTMEPDAPQSLVRAVEAATFLPTGAQLGFVAEALVAEGAVARGEAERAAGGRDEAAGHAERLAAAAARRARGGGANGSGFATGGRLGDGVRLLVLPFAPFAHDAAVAEIAAWMAASPSRRVAVVAQGCASASSAPSCMVLRFRPDGSRRPDADLAWLYAAAPGRVTFVPAGAPDAALRALAPSSRQAVPSPSVSCLAGGEPLFGVACWRSPDGTIFAVNLRDDAVTADVSVGGKPLTAATSVLDGPPFGVSAASLPSITLPRFAVAVLRPPRGAA